MFGLLMHTRHRQAAVDDVVRDILSGRKGAGSTLRHLTPCQVKPYNSIQGLIPTEPTPPYAVELSS